MGISHYQDMKPLACTTVSAKCGATLQKHHHVPITVSLRVHRVGNVAIHGGHAHQIHCVPFLVRITIYVLLYAFFWVIPWHLKFICPKESIQHLEHGESLKSRIYVLRKISMQQ
jgi:hypothetical protein